MDYRDLHVYRKAFSLVMEVYEISKKFLKEETYSLTGLMRRSSWPTCSNVQKRIESGIIQSTLPCKLIHFMILNPEKFGSSKIL
ncbi:four helix bundle protein [Mariniphaga sediminis]|uniref:four helix bundle protein n=1 Tax=Mariniphaga sediminis TaxID=1628158 RepID=UPI0019D44277|nr:four helix bundle protein [Mariniphaga sediminis]